MVQEWSFLPSCTVFICCSTLNFTFRSFTVALSTLQIAYWKLFFWTFFYNYKHFYSNFFYNYVLICRRNHQNSTKSKNHAWGWIWTGDPWIRRPVSYHWATEVVGFWSVQKALCTYLTYCKWPECEVQLYTVLLEKIYGAKCFWLVLYVTVQVEKIYSAEFFRRVLLIYMHEWQGGSTNER